MKNIIIFLVIIILSSLTVNIEPFRLYMTNSSYLPISNSIKNTEKIRPVQSIPPGVTNIHKKFKNKGMIFSKSDYCNDNPTCYPCPNWKHVGPPVCI